MKIKRSRKRRKRRSNKRRNQKKRKTIDVKKIAEE